MGQPYVLLLVNFGNAYLILPGVGDIGEMNSSDFKVIQTYTRYKTFISDTVDTKPIVKTYHILCI